MEILEKLGIDWRLLIAQLVNFAILATALTFLVYKPIVGVLEKRQKKIADSLKDAERISEELASAKTKTEEAMREARVEAAKVVSAAQASAESVRAAAAEKAKAEVALIIASGKKQLAAERDAAMGEVRAAAAELVSLATHKVIGEKLSGAKDKQLVDKIVETV